MTEREVMADLVRFVGVLTYGKERWFKQNGCWYDRMFGDYIQNEVLLERITKAINDEIEDRPTGEWIEVDSFESEKHSVTDMRCSLCGKYASMVLPHRTRCVYDFCPNCGAKMKGGRMITHEIKLEYTFQDAVLRGDKCFEVRYNDRGYQRGDRVKFKVVNRRNVDEPLDHKIYEITYVLSGWGIKEDYVVFGIKPLEGGESDG